MIIPALILFLIILNIDIHSDKKKYEADPMKSKASVNHSKEWLQRLIQMLLPITLLVIKIKGLWFIIAGLATGGMALGFLYWILFDGLYNIVVLKESFFDVIGTTSALDKFQQKIGKRQSVILKFTFLIIFSVLYAVVRIKMPR